MNITINKPVVDSLLTLANVIEARDTYTGGHLWRVAQFSKILARRIGLSEDEVIISGLGGFLHDLGKIGVPDSILLKPDRLNDKEFDVVKTHPGIGYDLIRTHPLAELVQDAIYQHHEWANGEGYPQQLHKEEISIRARIVGIADAFDAMTSTRVYRQGMSAEKALSILEQERDKQFDGELVRHMIELGKTDDLNHIVSHSDEGIPMVTCYKCGPIIVVQRDTKDGDHVFCNGCAGKFQLHKVENTFESVFVDVYGSAEEVRPQSDTFVIQDILKQLPSVIHH